MYQHRMIGCRFLIPAVAVASLLALPRSDAQVTSVRSGSEKFDRDSARVATAPDPATSLSAARSAQLQFEQYRRNNLAESRSSRGGGSCDEQVGRFC